MIVRYVTNLDLSLQNQSKLRETMRSFKYKIRADKDYEHKEIFISVEVLDGKSPEKRLKVKVESLTELGYEVKVFSKHFSFNDDGIPVWKWVLTFSGSRGFTTWIENV